MRILEKAEGAFGACVVYEHDGMTFRACGTSIQEIEHRLRQGQNGALPVPGEDDRCADVPETAGEPVSPGSEDESEKSQQHEAVPLRPKKRPKPRRKRK
jgi:hypothetical protein